MATLRANIFSACTTDATLTALIGSRCYPIRLPADATLPAISYRQISDDDMDWRAHGESAPRSVARISFDCWGETSDDTSEVADALIALWSGYTQGSDIGWSQILLRLDNFEESLNRYRTVVDINVEYAR